MESLVSSLRQEILFARHRIYEIGQSTPLDTIELDDLTIFVKREDLTPIHAYKWRGAYNCMAQLTTEQLKQGVVTASAGNHAQGVALAAQKLGTPATVFMPLATPQMKQKAVQKHGGAWIDIRLTGDSYDEASAVAHAFAAEHELTYIHAYDDITVMAGQGTLADEIIMSGKGPFDVAFLQVGGGGMAAATATWLKMNFPNIHIVGVEGDKQASMAAAIQAGHPVALKSVDIFCDGTAVRKVGKLTHKVCSEVIDEWLTVSNDEVSAAVQFLWEHLRCIPEPSGAMGIAGILQRRTEFAGKRVLSVLCGANMDFEQLALISRRAAVGASRRRFLQMEIDEKPGAMYNLLRNVPQTINIGDFQYGKTHADKARPVVGFDVDPMQFELLKQSLDRVGYMYQEVTSETDVVFRLIPYEAPLLHLPCFITLEFHERTGALAEFLSAMSPHANLCYFNYVYSGERVGRALLGFEFENPDQRGQFINVLESAKSAYRAYEIISEATLKRILS